MLWKLATLCTFVFSVSRKVVVVCFSKDVHEIKFGVDWQDALNTAVSSCEVFVPLVTERYGETLWTNREVLHACYILVIGKSLFPGPFMMHVKGNNSVIQSESICSPQSWKSDLRSEIDYSF